MKLSIVLFTTICLAVSSRGQHIPAYRPSFFAVVVTDVSSASKWYASLFGLVQKNRITDPAGAYDIAILESEVLTLELLQLRGSVSRAKALNAQPPDTAVQGHFKVGITVTDFDQWMKHLAGLKITVPRIYTDDATKKRNMLVADPDGNLIQIFEG